MDLRIRRIDAEEWEPYRRLRLEALAESPLAFVEQYDDVITRPESFWKDRVARSADGSSAATFVAVDEGEFVGMASCFAEPEITEYVSAHVVGVYVRPPSRGHGIAESMVAQTVRWAREDLGATRVRLFVLTANESAMNLYLRMGFHFTGVMMAYPPDPSLVEREMELPRRLLRAGRTA